MTEKKQVQNVIHLTIQAQVALYGDEPFGQQTVLYSEISTAMETCRVPLRDHVQHAIEDAILAQVTAEPDEDYAVAASASYTNHMKAAMASIYHDGYAIGITESILWLEGYCGETEAGQRLIEAFKAKFHEATQG